MCRRGEQTDAIRRLKLGPMDAGDTGEGLCVGSHTQTHTHTRTRFTQVRGPREEVKPLLLLLVLIYVVTIRVTEELSELYASYWKMRQVFLSFLDPLSRRRPWGTL